MGHKARATRLNIGKLLIELRSQVGRERLTKWSSPRRREGRMLVDGGRGRAGGAHAPERTVRAGGDKRMFRHFDRGCDRSAGARFPFSAAQTERGEGSRVTMTTVPMCAVWCGAHPRLPRRRPSREAWHSLEYLHAGRLGLDRAQEVR